MEEKHRGSLLQNKYRTVRHAESLTEGEGLSDFIGVPNQQDGDGFAQVREG